MRNIIRAKTTAKMHTTAAQPEQLPLNIPIDEEQC
jgi:hypothetical protein